ncbi:MAG: hypothetical protein IPL35_09910 [Sphingobacteriales bacterium]|nr:hypothetical protein [Sphingobacteriales bacterium]
MIQEIAGGTITADIIDEYPQVVAKAKVKVRYEQVRKLAGTPDISNAMIEHILSALEMDIVARETADSVTVAVPTNKVDVTREVDVIEEILRIYGYNNMPIPQAIYATLTPSPSPDVPALRETVATTLTARGFSEIMNNSLTNSQYYGHHQADTVTLLNSLNKNLDVLRKDLVRGALEAVRHNLNYKNTNCRFFEFGKVYHRGSDTTYTETEQLLILMSGSKAESWQQKSRAYQFFDLKQHLQYLWQRLALQPDMGTVFESELLEYGIGYYSDRHLLAEIGAVRTELLEQFDIPQPVYAAIVQWDNIVAARRQYAFTFKPLPKFPSVRRDLALLLDKTVSYAQLEKAVYQQAPPYLQEINIFDLYEDEQKIGAGKKSYALSFVLQAVDKTLTDADIDTAMKKILEILVKEFGIIQR